MINRIGIKNFRVFKEMTEFQLRPLTILTGPNNSGKSSFSKFLLLLQNGIEKLNFQKGEHNLGSFQNVLNWDKINNLDNFGQIVIRLSPDFLPNSFSTDLIHSEYNFLETKTGKLIDFLDSDGCYIKVHKQNDVLFNISRYKEDYDDFVDDDGCQVPVIGTGKVLAIDINIIQLIDIIYTKEFIVPCEVGGDLINVEDNEILLSNFHCKKETGESITTKNLIEDYNRKAEILSIGITNYRNIALSNDIDKFKKDYKLYNVLINGKDIELIYPDFFLALQVELFNNFKIKEEDIRNGSIEVEGGFFEKSYSEQISYGLSVTLNKYIKKKLKKEIIKKYRNDFHEEDVAIRIKETDLGDLIFNRKLFDRSSINIGEVPKDYFQRTFINCLSPKLENPFEKIERFGINRATQKRVLLNNGNSEMEQVMSRFGGKLPNNILHDINNEILNRPLIRRVLKILEIEGKLLVEQYENTITVLYIENPDGKIINLCDLGFGYAQIITLVLKIIFTEENDIYLIEEPEANLHPDFQSKLADIFALIIKDFRTHASLFIIETHSEYLIRKLQYLVAKESIVTSERQYGKVSNADSLETKDVIIYYFNDDKYVSKSEPKVKEIEITKTGNLTDTFGPGFYDEAIKLQFDLMALNKEQHN